MTSTARRDEGLRRISALTRWAAGGAIVLAGVLSAVVARALPGKASAAPAPAAAVSGSDQGPPQGSASPSDPSDPSTQLSDNGSLSPPPIAPAPGRAGRGAVVSGGS